jgi:hypothetical protein
MAFAKWIILIPLFFIIIVLIGIVIIQPQDSTTPTEASYSNEINVDSPIPESSISSPLIITGQARGSWYFEANFPIELVDANGQTVGATFAQAEGEWMTEDFVPFSAEMTFGMPSTQTGELIVKNANASGLPENDKFVIIPVSFE